MNENHVYDMIIVGGGGEDLEGILQHYTQPEQDLIQLF